MLNRIFSVKKDYGRTIYTIFGLKIKISTQVPIASEKYDAEKDLELMKKHLEKISNSTRYGKFGLISYTYDDTKSNKKISYHPKSMNIGDYIQSIAARQFLPSVDVYIDRDTLSEYHGDNVNLIMNAWWYFYEGNRLFSDKINPLFVSMHINNPTEIEDVTVQYLKEHEPIGCRDYTTRNFLLSKGVEAYFSGCLTLTLGKTYNIPTSKRDNIIYIVDVKKKNKDINKRIQKILDKYSDCEVKYVTHNFPFNNNIEENFAQADMLLQNYAKAKLVITSKIHCAMPCIAMNTPVILVSPKFDPKRFTGLYNFYNYIGKNEYDKLIDNINYDENELVINKNDYKFYADFLAKICEKFAE